MAKILIIGDLHGRMPRIHFKDFDFIVCIGDVCSDKFLRLFYKKYFAMIKEVGVEKVPNFEDFLEEELGGERHEELLEKGVVDGRKILEKLNSFGVPVFFVPGNWDNSYGSTRIKDMDKNDYNHLRTWLDWWLGRRSNKKLIGGLENVHDLQYGLYESFEFNLLGYGLISGPEKLSKRVREAEVTGKERAILKKLSMEIPRLLRVLWKKRNKKAPSIFISHNVPYGVMDIIHDKKSHAHLRHAGSTVARNFCLKNKPEVCVGGHIHEYYGKKKLGKTTVVNAGFGRDAQVLLEIKGKKVNIKFVESLKRKYSGKK